MEKEKMSSDNGREEEPRPRNNSDEGLLKGNTEDGGAFDDIEDELDELIATARKRGYALGEKYRQTSGE